GSEGRGHPLQPEGADRPRQDVGGQGRRLARQDPGRITRTPPLTPPPGFIPRRDGPFLLAFRRPAGILKAVHHPAGVSRSGVESPGRPPSLAPPEPTPPPDSVRGPSAVPFTQGEGRCVQAFW